MARAISCYGSDTFYEINCSRCAKAKRNTEAVKYCQNCSRHFCRNCLVEHDSFLDGHKVVDITDENVSNDKKLSKVACATTAVMCQDHPGNQIGMFCRQHDVVCCNVCISLVHRKCTGFDNLPSIVKGIKTNKNLATVTKGMKDILPELKEMESIRENDLKGIINEKDKYLATIDIFEQQMTERLHSLVNVAKQEVKAVHTVLETTVKSDMQKLQKNVTHFNTSIASLEEIQNMNEVQVFINMKKGEENLTKGKQLLTQMQRKQMYPGKESFNFSVDSEFKQKFMSLKKIGDAKIAFNAANLHGNFNIKVKGDKIKCHIMDSCVLDDGSIVLTDFNNNKLKKLDTNYKVTDKCDLMDSPMGICTVGKNEMVVALFTSLRIIHVVYDKNEFKIMKKCSVKSKPYYLAFHDKKLFITCRSPATILVLSFVSGNFSQLMSISNDTLEQKVLSEPLQIIFTQNGNRLHVTDRGKMTTLDQHLKIHSTFIDEQLGQTFGLCQMNDYNLLVFGYEHDKIFQLSGDLRIINGLLSKENGVRCPRSIVYDRNLSRLIVSMSGTEEIKVFNLSRQYT